MRGALAVALIAAGCRYAGQFECVTDAQCANDDVSGACVGGSCAFEDPACAAGWRFAASAEPTRAEVCLEDLVPEDCASWQPRHLDACRVPPPLGSVQIGGTVTYDTDAGAFDPALPHTSIVIDQVGGGMVRVISVEDLVIDMGAALRVRGSLPVVVAARRDIRVDGSLQLVSNNTATGAGANPPSCSAGMAGQDAMMGSVPGPGGGAGGSFQGEGGSGGTGGANPTSAGGAPGAAVASFEVIRGGCPGTASGMGTTPADVGMGGDGGGAVQLAARGQITIAGTITVGGAGGRGGPAGATGGGGGGGSGGWIGLDAPTVTIAGAVAANGGGGGGAPGPAAEGPGGANGTTTPNGAAGGSSSDCNGSGGTGSAGATLDGGDAPSQQRACGGGGGGGGAGVITVRSPAYTAMPTARVTPPALVDPS